MLTVREDQETLHVGKIVKSSFLWNVKQVAKLSSLHPLSPSYFSLSQFLWGERESFWIWMSSSSGRARNFGLSSSCCRSLLHRLGSSVGLGWQLDGVLAQLVFCSVHTSIIPGLSSGGKTGAHDSLPTVDGWVISLPVYFWGNSEETKEGIGQWKLGVMFLQRTVRSSDLRHQFGGETVRDLFVLFPVLELSEGDRTSPRPLSA